MVGSCKAGVCCRLFFFFSSRRRHTRFDCDWSSDVCSSDLLRRLFEPLGYNVVAEPQPLDPKFPEWGQSRYFRVTLSATKRLSELLGHLYVLVPVLDDEKHYWVTQDEVEKLLRYGEGWLSGHPERELIAARYLKHQRGLVAEALARLVVEEEPEPEEADESREAEEAALEHNLSLNEQRIGAVLSVLKGSGAKRVLDLGCGEEIGRAHV